jgi:hypothetical protein
LTATKGISPLGAQAFPRLPVSRRKAIVITFGGALVTRRPLTSKDRRISLT